MPRPQDRGGSLPKRNETVPVKLSGPEKELFKQIGKDNDRPLGYVIRELALRGKKLYDKDRQLKEPDGDRTVEIEPLEEARAESRRRKRG